MSVIVVTGSGGLIGSQAVTHFAADADTIVGIDNNMRAEFFGPEASTCLLYTSPSPRDRTRSRMPSSA